MTNFLEFSKNPKHLYQTEKWSNIIILQFLILFIILGSPASGLPYILSKLQLIETKISHLTFQQKMIQGLLIAPVVEECIFRLILKENKTYFLITAVICITIIAVEIIMENHISAVVFMFILIVVAVISFFHVKRLIDLYSQNNYKYLYWCTIILYGLLHGLNFRFTNHWHIILIPLLTMPQIILGSILSYIRVKYGIFYSIIFHFIVNTQILFTH
ncbi:MAG: hypothetical protein PHH93_06645 [Prolixibacteraceae bacterium]|nr:hypothetical protein [Prolixibacteraceae bacterium]